MGIINTTLINPSPAQNHTILKICNTLALPTLVYGCGSWAIKEQVVSDDEIYHKNSKIKVARLQSKRRDFIRT
jgi:hypothetical protein